MLSRSDLIAATIANSVEVVLQHIRQIPGVHAQTIGAYQMGMYVYPEAVAVNASSNNGMLPHGVILRLVAKSLSHLTGTDNMTIVQGEQSCAPIRLEFSVGLVHFCVTCGQQKLARLDAYTRNVYLQSPLCRFAGLCMRHLVMLFSMSHGLAADIISAHAIGTLVVLHHHVFQSTPGPPLTLLGAPAYIRSLVAFIRGLKANRVYTATEAGQVVIDRPPDRSQSLQLDNPCILHPLCRFVNVLEHALYFPEFQRWITVQHFVWLCQQP